MTMTRRTFVGTGTSLSFAIAANATLTSTSAVAAPLWGDVSSPVGMAFNAKGDLLVAEWSAGRITSFSADGSRTTFASGLPGPSGLAIDAQQAVYVASYSESVVYRFAPDGTRSTFVTGLATPAGISFDRSGRLMIANRRTNQILVVIDGKAAPLLGDLNTPVGVTQTPDGGYVVSNLAGGVAILRPDGQRVEAGQAFRSPGVGLVGTEDGRVFAVDYGGTEVREILMSGGSRPLVGGLSSPVGLAMAPGGGALLVGTWGDSAVHKIPLPGTAKP